MDVIFVALPAHCYWHTRFTSSPLGSISPKRYIYIRCELSYNPYIQMNLMKVNYALKIMNIEKSIVKSIKIDTTRNKEKDMKKMKSIEKESRGKEDYLKVKLFSVLFVISQ